MPIAHLADRAVIRVSGEEARGFLDRLVTCDLDRVAPDRPRFGALLTPQGKILADFILYDASPTFLLDVPMSCATDLARRLSMYKLRAKVSVADVTEGHRVAAGWGSAPLPDGEVESSAAADEPGEGGAPSGELSPSPCPSPVREREPAPASVIVAALDPRLPALGWRAIVARDAEPVADAPEADYHAHRIAEGVPEGGRDYAFGDAFPHEALMDQLFGVDFDKGCYVGQEVVSRMQHRGTARTRIVPLDYSGGDAPRPGIAVVAGERALGLTGSGAGSRGLAMLRLDRLADALEAGVAVTAEGRPARLAKPDWVRFPYPGESAAPAA